MKQNPFDCDNYDLDKSYCNKTKHRIDGGEAIKFHCSKCQYFKKK